MPFVPRAGAPVSSFVPTIYVFGAVHRSGVPRYYIVPRKDAPTSTIVPIYVISALPVVPRNDDPRYPVAPRGDAEAKTADAVD